MRRKLVSLILTALMLFSCCQGVFAENCTHEWKWTYSTEYNMDMQVCSKCGAKGTSLIACNKDSETSCEAIGPCIRCGRTLPAGRHLYPSGNELTEYTWSVDAAKCTAKRECVKCFHVDTAEGTVEQTSSTAATLTEYGTLTYTATFSVDWARTQTKTITNGEDPPKVSQHKSGHGVSFRTVWATDYSSCTAQKWCHDCGGVVETDNATITRTITTQPTCTTDGLCDLTASFTKSWALDMTSVRKNIKVNALGHSLKEVEEDGQYYYKCEREGCDYQTAKSAASQSIVITGEDKVCKSSNYTFTVSCPAGYEPTATFAFAKSGDGVELTKSGEVYTGSISSSGFTYVDDDESFKLEVYYSLADGTKIAAQKNVLVLAEHSYGEATCTEPKVCSLCDYRDEGSELGHLWNDTTYEWKEEYDEEEGDDVLTCTATRVCKRNSKHVETAKATISSSETTAATCTTDGVRTYTATFDVDWATTRTKTEPIEKLGHDFEAEEDKNTKEYWKKCTREGCGYISERKSIPDIEIIGSDKVCNDVDYTFSFTPPKGYEKNTVEAIRFIAYNDYFLVPPEYVNLVKDANGTYKGIVNADYYRYISAISYLGGDEISGFYISLWLFLDEDTNYYAGDNKVVNVVEHDYSVEATCKSAPSCSNCGKEVENGERNPNNHSNLQYLPAKEATTKEEGNLECWYCDGCGKYYTIGKAADESEVEGEVEGEDENEVKREVKREDVIIPKLPADENKSDSISNSTSASKSNSNSPATSDDSDLAGWLALMAVGAALSVVIEKKKKCVNK